MTTGKGDALSALRSLAAAAQPMANPQRVANFLRQTPELKGADARVTFAAESVAAGASGGIVLFRLDVDDARYRGEYALRFSLGADGIFRQTSLKCQFDIMRAVHARGLPVAEPVWIDEAGLMGLGENAMIMRRIAARAPNINYLVGFAETAPEMRGAMLRSLLGVAARLHRLPLEELDLPALRSRGGAGEYFLDREINWTQAELHARFPAVEEGERAALHTEIRATLDRTADLLRERAPRHRQPAMVHGDFTLANVMFNDDGSVAALLDWELCHEGLPEEDVAYSGCSARGRTLLAKAEPVYPSQAEMIALYSAAGGVDGANWEYATALSAFRLATWGAIGTRRLPKESWGLQGAVWAAQREVLSQAVSALKAA